jgi:predicted esterase
MIQLADRIDPYGQFRWLAPRADNAVWYPNRFMDAISSNEPSLSEAIEQCAMAVEEASEQGRLGPEDIVIVGFSQGGCLATEYILRRQGRLKTLVVFTGGLIGLPGTVWGGSASQLEGIRVLITGSDVDEWVPERRVRETAQVLVNMGAQVRLRMYQGRPHVVSDEEIAEARDFIKESSIRNKS